MWSNGFSLLLSLFPSLSKMPTLLENSFYRIYPGHALLLPRSQTCSQYTASLCLTSFPCVAGLVSHAHLCLRLSCVLTRMATMPSFPGNKRDKTAASAGEIKGICGKCAQFYNSWFLKAFQKPSVCMENLQEGFEGDFYSWRIFWQRKVCNL